MSPTSYRTAPPRSRSVNPSVQDSYTNNWRFLCQPINQKNWGIRRKNPLLDAILALHPPLSPLLQSREGRTRLNPPHLRPLPQGERKLPPIPLPTKNEMAARHALLAASAHSLAMTDKDSTSSPARILRGG